MQVFRSGETPLIKNDALCHEFGVRELYVKDESKNPFGTWKDRRSELILKKAKSEFVDKLCLITSGNAGFSLAGFTQNSGTKIVSIVDLNLPPSIKESLKNVCHKVIEIDLSKKILKPEEVIALARENEREVVWDVTNGYHNAFESVVDEIAVEKPDYLVCPVGSGEAYVGLFDGLVRMNLKTTLIGVTAKENPSFADKLHTPWTPYANKIRSILDAGHKLIELNEDEIKVAFDQVKGLVECEPSSAVVFGITSQIKLKNDDKIILVNSGKGLILKGKVICSRQDNKSGLII